MEKEIGFLILIALVGYLVGSFPTGYVIVRRFARKNILEWGTGNVGTLNTLRATNSKLLTLATLSGDVLKGMLALLLGFAIARAGGVDTELGAATGGIMAVVGHNYAVFLKFQGGKGIATSLPVLLYLAPLLVVLWIGVFFLTVATTRLLGAWPDPGHGGGAHCWLPSIPRPYRSGLHPGVAGVCPSCVTHSEYREGHRAQALLQSRQILGG